MTWMPDYKEGLKVETPEGMTEVRKINGFLVFLSFETEGNSGGIVVQLQEAASNAGNGAVFVISFQGLALDEALKTAQRFNCVSMKAQAAKLRWAGAAGLRTPAPRSPALPSPARG